MKDIILDEYLEKGNLYSIYGDRCKSLLIELLNDNSINIHHITCRIKKKDSLERKLELKIGKYSKLSDITDICGIRIITYLDSDVDRVADIIAEEFKIDNDNSIDKRKLKSDQFGYRSLHYVISLNDNRADLSENRKFENLKCEIQIRSILQHAWAEIEHDLGYKGEISIPEEFKRNFNRLAALLEIADIEFDRLKNDLSKYESNIIFEIENNPDEVKVDKASLLSFVLTNNILENARKIILRNTGCEFYNDEDLAFELERLNLFGIKSIGSLEALLKENERHYLAFTDLYTVNFKDSHPNLSRLGITLPIFYFLHYLAAKSGSDEFVNEYLEYGNQKLMGGVKNLIEVFNKSNITE